MSDLRLAPGSRYRVTSAGTEKEPLVTEGTFDGITSIGSIDAMIMKLEGDDTRLVPTHAILSLDILEQAEHKDEEDDAGAHYV